MKILELGYIFKHIKSITVTQDEQKLFINGEIGYLKNASPMVIYMSTIPKPTSSNIGDIQAGDFIAKDDYLSIWPGETIGPLYLSDIYLHTDTVRKTGAKLLIMLQES